MRETPFYLFLMSASNGEGYIYALKVLLCRFYLLNPGTATANEHK